MANIPQPKTGGLSGKEGTIQRAGSGSRLARSMDVQMNPREYARDRCNEVGIDDLTQGEETY